MSMRMIRKIGKGRRRPNRRSRTAVDGGRTLSRAAAAVEMAIVTPLLLLMIFGVIEFGWVFWIQETLTNATREGCRVAVLPGSTDADIRARFDQAVSPTGLTITSSMLTLTHATANNPIETVQVVVPRTQVSLVGGFLGFTSGNVTATCTMRKEGS